MRVNSLKSGSSLDKGTGGVCPGGGCPWDEVWGCAMDTGGVRHSPCSNIAVKERNVLLACAFAEVIPTWSCVLLRYKVNSALNASNLEPQLSAHLQ